ncbi:hypothetical protein [Priestia aryabhattai]|uniref:hypothetical protein n=1 Tax=Priestia aryabhattai TaxID=412384 RepID=UPI00064E85C7|nr:hypothetical protein [Priestia aryabhattai]KML27769.1 hypothetical protein VL11_17505 [Priestia aryabhattai]KMO01924.1 hypothetical protein ABV89_00120 [Priestia aryabhattai]
MNFCLYEISDINKLNKLIKQKPNFFAKKHDVEIFHINELKQGFHHLVFHVADEYHFGTKHVGQQVNVPFSQYVNCFVSLKSSYILIEFIHEHYSKEIITLIEQKTKAKIVKREITKTMMLHVANTVNGYVKTLEYTNLDDEEEEITSFTLEKFNSMQDIKDIYYLLLSVEDKFVSLNRKGIISVNNSEEDYLIKFTEVVINALDCN